jgi:hypothetical protein
MADYNDRYPIQDPMLKRLSQNSAIAMSQPWPSIDLPKTSFTESNVIVNPIMLASAWVLPVLEACS